MEEKVINLNLHKGFPMYFLCERKKTETTTRITFVDLQKHENIDYYVLIGKNKYKITGINEIRISGSDYGVEQDVWFHDVIAELLTLNPVQNGK